MLIKFHFCKPNSGFHISASVCNCFHEYKIDLITKANKRWRLMRYHFSHPGLANFKRSDHTECWRGHGATGTFTQGGSIMWFSHCENSSNRVFAWCMYVNIHMSYGPIYVYMCVHREYTQSCDPAFWQVSLPETFLNTCARSRLKNVHSSFIQNG